VDALKCPAAIELHVQQIMTGPCLVNAVAKEVQSTVKRRAIEHRTQEHDYVNKVTFMFFLSSCYRKTDHFLAEAG